MTASAEDLAEVSGIGDGTAGAIRRAVEEPIGDDLRQGRNG